MFFTLSNSAQRICRSPARLLFFTIILLLTTLYSVSRNIDDENRSLELFPNCSKEYEAHARGYLVHNSKCRILNRNPFDPSIRKFVKKERFEACRETPLLTEIITKSEDESTLKIVTKLARNYVGLSCCWAPIVRPEPQKNPDKNVDSKITKGSCTKFKDEAILPKSVEVVLVECEANVKSKWLISKKKVVYKNVHAVLQVGKVREKLKRTNGTRQLSILLLGMDNISRLNFERSMPKTKLHLDNTGWTDIRGYNKVGENTFPNLMAILTGQNISRSYEVCPPRESFGLENCPMIWYNFRNANYVTAYGEDAGGISTFNYLKSGFVNPPTDFYLRPSIIAAEKYLTLKRHLNNDYYCTGPELSGDRVLNYGLNFAKAFIGVPYFGFFWTNTMSHDDLNGPSSVDDHILNIIQRLDIEGILNDSMVIFLSDHGMRYGGIRETVQGWFEERLPFNYVWLPEWFKKENPESFEALKLNGKSLTSPFNIYETLRDVLIRAGGNADQSISCPRCESLFRPAPTDRGCDDVGINQHWCSCTAPVNGSIDTEIVTLAAKKIVRHIEDITEEYKNPQGTRICANLTLTKILAFQELADPEAHDNANCDCKLFLCQLQVHPGDAKFEAMIRYNHEDNEFNIIGDEVSRINSYADTSGCLKQGDKQYCCCH